jgi:type I restriction enzyme S subunit
MSNDELPIGWSKSKIGNLCSLKNGRAFKPTEWTTSGLPIVRIQNLNNPKSSYNYFSGEPEPRYHLLGGELLFAWSGTPGTSFGAHVWRGGEAVLNQHIFRVDFDEENIDKRFFRYAINQKLDELIDVAHGGVGLRHVTKGTFEGTEVKVPPRAEQKRLADKLEAVLGRVDACRARLDRVPALLKRFRQSVLAAATSGKLTEQWRITHGVIDEWENETVGSIITKIEAGLNVQCDERPPRSDEKGLVKISAVTWGTYDDEKSKTLPPRLQVPESTRIGVGDFLISRANTLELVGACVIVHKASRPVYLSDKILRLVMPDDIKPWLLMVLQSPNGRKQIESLATGNQLSMRNLAQANLRQIQVPKPTPQERKEIVRQVEALFAFADRIEARLASMQKTVERLTPATLAKAFRGELVPQDPNDEPASALLERFGKQAEAKSPKSKRQKRS